MAASIPAKPERLFGAVIGLAFLAALIPRILAHEFWRDELHSWLVVTDGSPTLLTLARRVAYEGHQLGWYVILWAVAKVWSSFVAVKVVHAVLASLLVFVIAAFAPVPRWTRVLIIAGYFICFEYAVISRNYTVGVLPLFVFAALRTWRPDAVILQAVCLALAAQTNAFALLIAASASVWGATTWLAAGRPQARRHLVAAAVVAVGFAAAFEQLKNPGDRYYYPTPIEEMPYRFLRTMAGLWYSFVPLPSPTRGWWNTNLIDAVLSPITATRVAAVLGGVVAVGAYWVLPRRNGARRLWLIGTFVVVAFGTLSFPGYLRHHGHFFVLFLIAWWIARAPAPTSTQPADTVRSSSRGNVITGLLIVQAIAGLSAAVADVRLPFSAAEATARSIRTRFPDAFLMGAGDAALSPLAALLDRPIYYTQTNRRGTFVIWDTVKRENPSVDALNELTARLAREESPRPILYVRAADARLVPDPQHFVEVGSFQDATVLSERYTIYQWRDQPATQTASDPLSGE